MEEFGDILRLHFTKKNQEKQVSDNKKDLEEHLQKKHLGTKTEIMDAFTQAFQKGFLGFHLCPTRVCRDEKCVMGFLSRIFHDISQTQNFFYVRRCHCDYMTVYIDPRKSNPGWDMNEYTYGSQEGRYVMLCYHIERDTSFV